MIEEELLAMEHEAERRVREAGEREIEKGGAGAARRASQAMDAPMLEAAAIHKMRQRFRDLRVEIDHQTAVLRGTRRNSELRPDVKRHRMQTAGEKLAALAEQRRTLEAESMVQFPQLKRRLPARPGTNQFRHPASVQTRRRQAHNNLSPTLALPLQANATTLPGGATLHPATTAQATSTDWARFGRSLTGGASRAASAAGAGLTVLLTPTNAQESYLYFGGDERLRSATGSNKGIVEERDPSTGEWRETELVGEITAIGGKQGIWVVVGTQEQVNRAMIRPDDPAHQIPPLIPPEMPEMRDPESFPAEKRGPVIHVTPAELRGPDGEIFPIPDDAGPQILIFPDISGEFDSLMIQESRRGNDATRDHLDQVREWFLTQYPDWKHVGGGRKRGSGEQQSEHQVPGPGTAFKDEKGNHGDSRPGGKWADLTFKSPNGKLLHIQTVDVDKNGKPTERELDNAEAIRRATWDHVILIPKPTTQR